MVGTIRRRSSCTPSCGRNDSHATVRLVTVYEPVLADLRDPGHFSRDHGPEVDPRIYLEETRSRVVALGATSVEIAAVADPVSVTAGLIGHLGRNPAALVVVGRPRRAVRLGVGGMRQGLSTVPASVLVVPH